MTVQETPDGALGNLHAMRLVEIRGQLRQEQVFGLTDHPHDLVRMGFGLMQAIVAASSAWTERCQSGAFDRPNLLHSKAQR